MPWSKPEHEEGRFENRNPSGYGGSGYADFPGECAFVDKRPDTPCQQNEKTLEKVNVPDVDHLPDISLDVCLDIVPVPCGRSDFARVQIGHESPEKKFIGLERAPSFPKFPEGKGVEDMDCRASGK